MKLPIKKKYFDQIKQGKKELEWRAAHITFICEETGETLRREIIGIGFERRGIYLDWDIPEMSFKEFEEIFDDDFVICFRLKQEGGRASSHR